MYHGQFNQKLSSEFEMMDFGICISVWIRGLSEAQNMFVAVNIFAEIISPLIHSSTETMLRHSQYEIISPLYCPPTAIMLRLSILYRFPWGHYAV